MAAPTPTSKADLLTLVDTYIPTTAAPNIRAAELLDLDTKILDRVDGRILQTGTFARTNLNAYVEQPINLTPEVYTNQYIVMVTPVGDTNQYGQVGLNRSHAVTFTIANRTKLGFTILLYPHGGNCGNCRFWYAVFSKVPL